MSRSRSSLVILSVLLLACKSGHAAHVIASSPAEQPRFVWSGAITANSARITLGTFSDSVPVRIAYDTSPTISNPTYTDLEMSSVSANQRVVTFLLGGLNEDTDYYYSVEIDGVFGGPEVGHFRTFPSGSVSFQIAFASCSWTGSTHPVFTTIKNRSPLFFLHMGDMHYENIAINDPALFRGAFEDVLSSPAQADLYRSVPIAYIWDDHDFGPNNSDSTSPSREASRSVYQQYVPHYPLVEGSGNVAIYQSFVVGRVIFLLCDSRSARSPASAVDDESKTMLGSAQKAWFKSMLLRGRDEYALTVWINSLPWIGSTGDDGWYLYTTERREIANFIKENQITNLCMLSGDAHMLAVDDGTNSDYADGGGAGFPVMHAAPLDRTVSIKGGPYSHGVYTGNGLFGWMSTMDRGDSIFVTWTGKNSLDENLVTYAFGYEVDLSTDVATMQNPSDLPNSFQLYQNYPNPFNGSTIISFDLARSYTVRLTIHNSIGQSVKTVYLGRLQSGTHRFEWDGSDEQGKTVASGVYLYSLFVDGRSMSRSMTYIK